MTRRGIVALAHLAMAICLVAMSVPQLLKVPDQLASDYIPIGYGFFVLLDAMPIALAVAVVIGVRPMLHGRSGPLLVVDIIATLSSLSVLSIFIFANGPAFVRRTIGDPRDRRGRDPMGQRGTGSHQSLADSGLASAA